MSDDLTLDQYPLKASDKLRYGDTDRQGHVNNAVFATLFETGRVELLLNDKEPLKEPGTSFVVARLTINFVNEINWPGEVQIGTRVAKVGRSSVTVEQALFQNARCVATGESVIVLTDTTTRRSTPLSDSAVARLNALKSS